MQVLPYPERKSDYSFGLDYSINDNFHWSFHLREGGFSSISLYIKIILKDQLKNMNIKKPKYLKMMTNIQS